MHYPFENREAVDSGRVFPADFIAEGVDQTRGWFFTLHAIAGMVKDSVAYKSVISNGLVLDKEGNKMSKRLGNAINPFEAIEEHGSDPLRWYMISNSSPWDNLKFDTDGVRETARKLFATIQHTYAFFALYANVDGFDTTMEQVPVMKRPEIDRWILSSLNTLIEEVDSTLAAHEPTRAARAIATFVNDNLSNWYVRLNRKRFWGGEMTRDKLAAYQTLYTCLCTIARLMAPVSPFFSDRLYRDLTGEESVHLAFWPDVDNGLIDKELERHMATAQTVTSMVLALRRKVNIKVRQPLSTLLIPEAAGVDTSLPASIRELVLTEVNIKDIKTIGADEGFLVKRVKPDFKKLGPKFGKLMKSVAAAIAALDQQGISRLEREGQIELDAVEGGAVVALSDVEIISEDMPGWIVANEGNITVALDVTLTPELLNEGRAREIINRIQNIRKNRNYDITDRIKLVFEPSGIVDGVLAGYADYIGRQVLAEAVVAGAVDASSETVEVLAIDDAEVKVDITLN